MPAQAQVPEGAKPVNVAVLLPCHRFDAGNGALIGVFCITGDDTTDYHDHQTFSTRERLRSPSEASTSYLSDDIDRAPPARNASSVFWGLFQRGHDVEGAVSAFSHLSFLQMATCNPILGAGSMQVMVPSLPACDTMKEPKHSLQGTAFEAPMKSDGRGMSGRRAYDIGAVQGVNHHYTRGERDRLANVESIDYLPPNSEVYRRWLAGQPHR